MAHAQQNNSRDLMRMFPSFATELAANDDGHLSASGSDKPQPSVFHTQMETECYYQLA
jgi:hypothetical protein